MKKHRLEKFFSSVFGTHNHDENSDTLPNKEDVEKDVERILKILRAEESGHISSENSFDRSELASRLENFHKGYQVVHGRYNHLLGKIKNKFRSKKSDNGSFSIDFSSSDSDSESGSEEFSDKKSRKVQENKADQVSIEDYYTLQQQLENANIKNTELETMATTMRAKLEEGQTLTSKLAEREVSIITLKNELQSASDSVQAFQAERDALKIEVETLLEKGDDTNQRMICLQEENVALRAENAEAFNRMHEMEKAIEKSEVELVHIKDEARRVQFENSSLKEELDIANKEVANLAQQLTTSSEEAKALRSGNFVFLRRIQEAERALADFRDQAEHNTAEVTSHNERLLSENEGLKFRLEAADRQNSDLIQRVSAAEDAIESLKAEILRSSSQIQEAENAIEVMKTDLGNREVENLNLSNMNNDLTQQLRVKEVENESLASKHLEDVEELLQAEENASVLLVEIEKVKDKNSQMLVSYENLKLELEATNHKISELKLNLEAAEDEKQSLVTDISALMYKLQQSEKVIRDFEAATEQLGIDNSEMQNKIEDLSRELSTANNQSTNLKKAVESAEEEKQLWSLRSSEVLTKCQQVETDMKQLQEELEVSRESNSMMQQNQIKLQDEIERLRADNSQLKTNASNLDHELEASTLQLTDLNTKLEQLQEEISALEHNHNDLQSQKLDTEVRLDKKLSEILSLRVELEEVKAVTTNQIKAFTAQLDDVRSERDLLNNQKKELEEHIRSLTCRSLEDQEMIKNLQEEVNDRIHSEEVSLKDRKDSFDELLVNYRKLEGCLQESLEKLKFAEAAAEELGRKEETIKTLEADNEKQKKEIGKLDENLTELLEKLEVIETENADANRENAKLHKQVQNLEVLIRLSNQKIKITETENKEKVEAYKSTVEAMQKEYGELEGKLVILSGKSGVLEKELEQLKKLAEGEISALAKGYCDLESVFKENSGHILMQLSECSKEFKILKDWFTQLKNENQELSVRLKYKEGIMSVMKDEAENVQDKLAKAEKESAILRTKENEFEKRIKALEEMLKEKKKEVLDKDEAKREAIRQLCLIVEYHRENCAYLSQYIASVLKRSGRSS